VDLNAREVATLVPLVVLAFWIGVYPKPFFDVLEEPVNRIVMQVEKTAVYPEGVAGIRPVPHGDTVALALPETAPGPANAAD